MRVRPAIGKVFDAGTTPNGQPYFVKDYSKASRFQYCDKKRPPIKERLQLIIKVCKGEATECASVRDVYVLGFKELPPL
jgi:hypothetical protein